jgi:beta-glucosidase
MFGSKLLPFLTFVLITTTITPSAQAAEMQFPKGFQWGVATAAHQIEGYNTNSDWWAWEQTPGHIANGDKSGAACDSWNRVEEDIGMMKQLGVTAYRFSVEWAKIEPVEGQYDQAVIEHYRHQVELLRAAGIAPMITLHHFSFPLWLSAKGGWEWTGVADAFAAYTQLVYTQIAPGNRDWITINEPMVSVMGGYYQGTTPPGQTRQLGEMVPIVRGLVKAHAAAYHMLHKLASEFSMEVRVGMAHHLRTFDPGNWFNPLDLLSAHYADEGWNWMIPNALVTGHLDLNILWFVNENETIPEAAGTQDFIGVNYYTGNIVSFDPKQLMVLGYDKSLPTNDMGWEIYPEGFARTLDRVHGFYPDKPIIVTENGIADAADAKRPDYIRSHLTVLWTEIQKGVPVEGYYHWSLMDNFEWINGFTPRFGLYEMDYKTFDRIPRASATLYHDIIRDNGL